MLGAVLVSLRPRQWVKNLFVFAGLVFGQRLFTPAVWPALGAFAIFCTLSGAIYLVNDVADREKDRLHPKKRERRRPPARPGGARRRRRPRRRRAGGGRPPLRGLPAGGRRLRRAAHRVLRVAQARGHRRRAHGGP